MGWRNAGRNRGSAAAVSNNSWRLLFLLWTGMAFWGSATAIPHTPNEWHPSILPDTNLVVPLFGAEGPRWQLDHNDTVVGDNTTSVPQNITARVPGDVVSDLLRHGMIEDPYRDDSLWQQQDLWLGPQPNTTRGGPCQKAQTRIWTYSTTMTLNRTDCDWYLVVESLQMGATVRWNGVFVDNVTDQFLRYSWPVSAVQGPNHLSISFDPSIETNGRFMACSGGWDWAPYTLACDEQGRRIFSRGIVAPLYLMAVDQVALTHVVPKIYYRENVTGSSDSQQKYPKNASYFPIPHDGGYFIVNVEVHLMHTNAAEPKGNYDIVVMADFATKLQSKEIVAPSWNPSEDPSSDVERTSIVTFQMVAHRNEIDLWWPNGMGAQPLYHIQVALRKKSQRDDGLILQNRKLADATTDFKILDTTGPWMTKRIGFRTSAIVTINESATDNSDSNDDDGTGMHGMYLRINGAFVMARGANIIPADQLEGRYSFESHTNDITYRTIVESAAAARMNIIRVWGGGKVLPQAFYDACDEYGILVYQDQMFVDEDHHGPHKTPTIAREIQHTVRSLASHPSIVIWNGCNECQVVMGTDSEIYATFVLQIVSQEDDTRSIWPSSPSMYGWKSGVNKFDSKPNGKPLATRNPADHKGAPRLETHGPYQRGFSTTFPGVNGVDQHFPYPSQPNELNEGGIGPNHPNTFASEFGCSVWSSFESVSAMLRPEHWGLHGGAEPDKCQHIVGNENVCEGFNVMAQRNYPCDTTVEAYFGNLTSLDATGESAFQAQLYQCIISQTIWMKGDIERRRSENSFGIIIWQLNENWPTGGWGALEYSSPMPGQMLGGRWKPLMHLLENSLFVDVIAACGRSNKCYVRNDGIESVNATVTLEAWNIQGSRNRCSVATHAFNTNLAGGISSTKRFQYPQEWTSSEFDAILIKVDDADSGASLMKDSAFLWDFPRAIPNLLTTTVSINIDSIKVGLDKTMAIVSLSSDALALYVVLTTKAPGRFSENAFVLRPNEPKEINFVPLVKDNTIDMDLLKDSLRVEHLGKYFH